MTINQNNAPELPARIWAWSEDDDFLRAKPHGVLHGTEYVRADRAAPEWQVRAKIEGLIEDAIANAKVDYPAGREAGHSITWDSDRLLDDIIAALTPPPAATTDNAALVEEQRMKEHYRNCWKAQLERANGLEAALASREAPPAAQKSFCRNCGNTGGIADADDKGEVCWVSCPVCHPPTAQEPTCTGVKDKDGNVLFLGDRVRYRIEGRHTKKEYWNPEYEIIWKAPTFTLKHVGGGKDGGSHDFILRCGGGNGVLELVKRGPHAAPPPACQQEAVTVAEAIKKGAAMIVKKGEYYYQVGNNGYSRFEDALEFAALRALKGGDANG